MKIVFMGTPDFAKNILQGLVESTECEVVAVYTREDAVRGRGKKLVASPVKEFAIENNIPVETPKNFNDEDTVAKLANYKPDFIVVAAYGLILPKAVLDTPKYECLNVHGSLLPKWRGAAPVQRAILAGDKKIGYSIMKIGEGLDDGDYCFQNSISLENNNAKQVFNWIATDCIKPLIDAMKNIINGSIVWNIQDEAKVTIAHKIEKKELYFNNKESFEYFVTKIKASGKENPAKISINGKNVTVIDAVIDDGRFCIIRLKPDGKNEMDWNSFVAGLQGVDESELKWEPIE